MISFLLGFPAGLGLAARNWYRLGRRPMAFAHIAAGVIGMVLILALPSVGTGLAALINLTTALYLYYRTKATLADASRAGITVERGGAAAGFATVLAAWGLMVGTSILVLAVVLLAGNDTGVPVTTSGATPAASGAIASPRPTETPTPRAPSASTAPTPDLSECPTDVVASHQATDLEAQLPKRVGGRDLATWSVSGWCWLRIGTSGEGLAELAEAMAHDSIDVAHFRYAVAGRSDTRSDPPYFVFAAARPLASDEIDLVLYLLLGGAGFTDPRVDLADYERREIEGRTYFAGSTDMVSQDEHQRGRPYVYQTDSAMFVIIADDDAWAEDAIRQLPCCWGE